MIRTLRCGALVAVVMAMGSSGCSASRSAAADAGHGASPRGDPGAPFADGGLPDGAVFTGKLPECRWPARLEPHATDGAIALWSVTRVRLACGGCATGEGACGIGNSDNAERLPFFGGEPCVTACDPDQYAFVSVYDDSNEPGDYLPDPQLPTGCTGTRPAYTAIAADDPVSTYLPTVYCCPCE